MLAEGGEPAVGGRPWGNFSYAMLRQDVNAAMGRLEGQERAVIRMAYFAGFSNAEIAGQLGLTTRGVQRVLRRAISNLNASLERGRKAALVVLVAIASGRAGRWLVETVAPGGTQVVAAAVLAGAVAMSPAAPAGPSASGSPHEARHVAVSPRLDQHHQAGHAVDGRNRHGEGSGSTPLVSRLPLPVPTPKPPPLKLPKLPKL